MIQCMIELGLPVLCIFAGGWPTVSTAILSSSSTAVTWHEKLTQIKRFSQRSVDADLVRLNIALNGVQGSAKLSSDEPEKLNHTSLHSNGTWYAEGMNWLEFDTNRTQSNHTLYLTQSDSEIVDRASSTSASETESGIDSRDPHAMKRTSTPNETVDLWIAVHLVLTSLTLLVHFGWIGWIVMEPQFQYPASRCCCDHLTRTNSTSIQSPNALLRTTFHATHRVYLRLQLHLGLVGTMYALSVLCGKINEFPRRFPHTTPEQYPTTSSCDIYRTISLLLLTVYWLNVVLCCIISVRYVHGARWQQPDKSSFRWTKSKTETFLCYFHSGASWIYAILLHLCGLMFTHFPVHWSDQSSPFSSASDHTVQRARLRMLSIDCQLIPVPGSRGSISVDSQVIGHSCEFTLSEYALALVLAFLGDVIPLVVVVPTATALMMLSKRVASQVFPFKSQLAYPRYSISKGTNTDMSNDQSPHQLLSSLSNSEKQQNVARSMNIDPRNLRAFTCFGVWIAILGFGLLFTHSIRISLHIRHLRYHDKWCRVVRDTFARPVLDDSARTASQIAHPPHSRYPSADWWWHWWFPRLQELAEISLTCLVPAGFISLTQSLKTTDSSSESRQAYASFQLEPVKPAQSDLGYVGMNDVNSVTNKTTDVTVLTTNINGAIPASSSLPTGASLEPYELLHLGKFTRTQFVEQLNGKTLPGSGITDRSDCSGSPPDLCVHMCGRTVERAEDTTTTTSAALFCGLDKPGFVPVSVQVVSLHTFCCQSGSSLNQPGALHGHPGVSPEMYVTNQNSLLDATLDDKCLSDWMPTDSSVDVILVPEIPATSNPQ